MAFISLTPQGPANSILPIPKPTEKVNLKTKGVRRRLRVVSVLWNKDMPKKDTKTTVSLEIKQPAIKLLMFPSNAGKNSPVWTIQRPRLGLWYLILKRQPFSQVLIEGTLWNYCRVHCTWLANGAWERWSCWWSKEQHTINERSWLKWKWTPLRVSAELLYSKLSLCTDHFTVKLKIIQHAWFLDN